MRLPSFLVAALAALAWAGMASAQIAQVPLVKNSRGQYIDAQAHICVDNSGVYVGCGAGGGGGGGSVSFTAAASSPTYTAGTGKDGSVDLHGALRVLNMDSSGNVLDPNAALPAGTNLIGKLGIDQATTDANKVAPIAATSGGATGCTFEVAASDNHQVCKNGAGQVYTLDAFSIHTAAMFIRLYDAGTGFNGCNSATNLIWEGQIPGAAGTVGAGFVKLWPVGRSFTNGLSVCVTGAFGSTNTTSATASTASVNIGYK